MDERKHIVVTGINLRMGGTLSVYYDCLDTMLEEGYAERYRITAFVYKAELFEKYRDRLEIIELPDAVGHYAKRMYYEYFYFKKYSKQNPIYVWLSLHDMTANVKAQRNYTYCHNASPFAKPSPVMLRFSPTVFLMTLFYRYLYRIGIRKNSYVIVQQQWMREGFERLYHIHNVMVARPVRTTEPVAMTAGCESRNVDSKQKNRTFIYASVPRPFKNFEVIGEACRKLTKQGITDFRVLFTLQGSENAYASWLRKKYGDLPQIEWLGFLDREELLKRYQDTTAMIFPSRLESWGLPVSEYRETQNGMILADLPYAHEALGDYDRACFFDPDDSDALTDCMRKCLMGERVFEQHRQVSCPPPYASDWQDLLRQLIE